MNQAIHITILTPCYNEEGNVGPLCDRIRAAIANCGDVTFEHLFIDNASTDRTVAELRKIAAADSSVKVIINNRNFGHVRSPYHGLLQAKGDAVVVMASDLQDPPELIPEFIRLWQQGNDVVVGQKVNSAESSLLFVGRRVYYRLLKRIADVDLLENVTGFGLYSR